MRCARLRLNRPRQRTDVTGPQAVYVTTAKGVLFKVSPTTRIPRTFKRFCGLMGARASFTASARSGRHAPRGRLRCTGAAFPPIVSLALPLPVPPAVQLLQKLSIRASNGPEKLLRVIKQPVTKYLPVGAKRVGLEHSAPSVIKMKGAPAGSSSPDPRPPHLGTRHAISATARRLHAQNTLRGSLRDKTWCSWQGRLLTGMCVRFFHVLGTDHNRLLRARVEISHPARAFAQIEKNYCDDFVSISEFPLSAACTLGRICNALENKYDII